MVAPPLLDVHSHFFIRFLLDSQAYHDFSRLAYPSQTLYCQSSRRVQLIFIVQTFFIEAYWILRHFEFMQDWHLIELFCIQSFQGVTPPGRHTRPICH